MEYSIEALLPIVEKLTGKYTSLESSSVTYETARMLMEAVLYCIDEYFDTQKEELMNDKKLEADLAYQLGYERILKKVYDSKEIYESILENFNDFNCRNCSDTILKGIPQFFVKYDPKFNPTNHILTLDYPTVHPVNALCGVNAINRYLLNIKTEWYFLSAFDTNCVENLLRNIITDYKNLYLDNISYAVLLTCIGCMIAEKPVAFLRFQDTDIKAIEQFFKGDSVKKAEQKIIMLITALFNSGFSRKEELKEYFIPLAKDYAVRIVNGLKNNYLSGVFNIIG